MKKRILMAVAPFLASVYIRLTRATMRIRWRGSDSIPRIRDEHGPLILVFWHSRLVLMPYVTPLRPFDVLISRHRDARMLGRMLPRFDLGAVYGSSTRGGAAAMREMIRKIRSGTGLAIAPDGPKGPRRRAKWGALGAAKATGAPILPATYSANPAWRVGSWDRTLVPKPFSRGLFLVGDPIFVPRKADDEEMETLRLKIEREIDRLTDEADRETGIGPEDPKDNGDKE